MCVPVFFILLFFFSFLFSSFSVFLAMFTLAVVGACVFQVHTIGNTYMLHVFDMATDQGRILEQAGSDIDNWL